MDGFNLCEFVIFEKGMEVFISVFDSKVSSSCNYVILVSRKRNELLVMGSALRSMLWW